MSSNIELAKAVIAAWAAGDVATVSALSADDMTFSGPVPQPVGKEVFLGLSQATRVALPDFNFNPSSFQEEGDKVIIAIHITGTHTGTLAAIPGVPPVPPTGKHIDLGPERLILTIRNGKVSNAHADISPTGGFAGIYAQVGAPLPSM